MFYTLFKYTLPLVAVSAMLHADMTETTFPLTDNGTKTFPISVSEDGNYTFYSTYTLDKVDTTGTLYDVETNTTLASDQGSGAYHNFVFTYALEVNKEYALKIQTPDNNDKSYNLHALHIPYAGVEGVKDDFNADGIADILWRSETGGNYLWYMHADGTHAYKNIGGKRLDYALTATGDFNGDGITDILWRHKDGKNHIWYMNTDGSHIYKNIGTKSTRYVIAGTGDFNGDGIADILWRQGYKNYIWYMNKDGSHIYKNIGKKQYTFQGIGDFNMDGVMDILWRKGTTTHIWYMHKDGSHTYANIGKKNRAYQVGAIADLNADGIADILWRKGNINHVWYMMSDGSHVYKNIGSKPIEYTLSLVYDFNGDNIIDLLWRKNNHNYIWYMQKSGSHNYKAISKKSSIYQIQGSEVNNIYTKSKSFFLQGLHGIAELEKQNELKVCSEKPISKSSFIIGHRGARLKFPEHTKESYIAASLLGAGKIECDVTFTKDQELVCRHSQCDLDRTTNILSDPILSAKCTQSFQPAIIDDNMNLLKKASAKCCTSDITLTEYKTLRGKIESKNIYARNIIEYMQVDTKLYPDILLDQGTLMSHKESIELFKNLEVAMIPEIKKVEIPMPFQEDFTYEKYVEKVIDEYKELGVSPKNVFIQDRNLTHIEHIINYAPEFGINIGYSDQSSYKKDTDFNLSMNGNMQNLADRGVKYLYAPIRLLLENKNASIVPSLYSRLAHDAGLKIVAWTYDTPKTLQSISTGGGWYLKPINHLIHNRSDLLVVLSILVNDVGIDGIFSDWSSDVSYFINCNTKL